MGARAILFFTLLALPAAPAVAAREDGDGGRAGATVLLDFESSEPADGWTSSRIGLFDATAAAGETASGGRALGLRGKGDGGYLWRPIDVADWRPYRALAFFAKVDAAGPVEMRVAAAEGTSFRSRLRRFTLAPGGWREVVLPLAEFRWDFRRRPGRFSQVGRIVIEWDGGEGTVLLDDLRLLRGDRGDASCLPTVEERLALAFPDGGGRAISGANFVVLTDVPELTAAAAAPLLARLEAGLALLRERYRLPGEPGEPVPLAVFAGEEAYRAFFARLGSRYGANVEPPSTDGYSALGFAASTWDPARGADRPVLVHEAMHAAILRMIHLGSDGDWIQEGLASAVQARLHPEALAVDLRDRFERRARGEDAFLPLSVLLGLERPGLPRYPQLLSFFEFLAEERPEGLTRFWAELSEEWRLPHESGRPALERALAEPIEKTGAAWLDWGLAR